MKLSVWSIQEENLFYLIEASFPFKWPFLKYKQETCLSVNLLLHKTTRLLCLTSVVFCIQDIHFVWWAPHRWTHRRLRLLLPCPLPDCQGLSNARSSQMFWKKHHLYGLKGSIGWVILRLLPLIMPDDEQQENMQMNVSYFSNSKLLTVMALEPMKSRDLKSRSYTCNRIISNWKKALRTLRHIYTL